MVLINQHGEKLIVDDKSSVIPKVVIENNNVQSLAFDVTLEIDGNRPTIIIKVYNRIEKNSKSNLQVITPGRRLLIDENK